MIFLASPLLYLALVLTLLFMFLAIATATAFVLKSGSCRDIAYNNSLFSEELSTHNTLPGTEPLSKDPVSSSEVNQSSDHCSRTKTSANTPCSLPLSPDSRAKRNVSFDDSPTFQHFTETSFYRRQFIPTKSCLVVKKK